MKRLMALDGNNLMHRAFYALPEMRAPDGRPTNAIYGFLGMLIRLVADHKPDMLAVAFDMHGPTFRHEKYTEYKAGRKETPDDLRAQFPILKELLLRMGVAQIEVPRYEADDIMGTLGERARAQGMEAYLVSGDRDVFQLIGQGVAVLYANRGVSDMDILDREGLIARFGYAPERVTDLKALMGDASDHIPGIPGVGEKTAMNLLAQYDTLEEILAHPEKALKGAMLNKVIAGAESARFSKELATIHTDAPLERELAELALPELGREEVFAALEELGMPSLIERIRRAKSQEQQEQAPPRAVWPEIEVYSDAEAARAALSTWPEGAVALTLWPQIELASPGRHIRLALRGDLLSPGMEEGEIFQILGEFLKDRPVYFDDRKSALAKLRSHGIEPPAALGDAAIAGYLLYTMEAKGGLSPLAEKVFHEGGEGAALLWELCEAMHARIAEQGMEALYYDVEMPLTDVLCGMEAEGFAVDREALVELGRQYDAQLEQLQSEIHELAGESFNILSPKQLGAVLFEKLGLPAVKKTKSGYSTDSGVLEQLDHPIAQKVLEYRGISKLKGTYIDGLLAVIGSDGKVRTTFHQTITATGRISSAEPNLQNIPVRTEQGRHIRRAFVPGAPGNVLVDADYSQIELRVLAHMSGDENMQRAYLQGEDIHRRTAAEIFGVPIEEVTQQMRSSAKAVNFGVVYGISDFGLARNTGITRGEARGFIDMYFARYPGVRAFMDACVAKGKTEGYVTTMMGRRRYLSELSSPNYNMRSFGERAAMNTPIQGTAADIIKLAMVRVASALRQEGLRAKLILQVHDELIIDAPQEEAQAVRALLIREMEGAASLSVPMEADVHFGDNWDDAK